MMSMIKGELENHGFRCRIVSVHRLKELEQDIEGKNRKGEFGREFYQERLTGFQYRSPHQLPNARSVLIASCPQPELRLKFHWKGMTHSVGLPPTYQHHANAILENLLNLLLLPYGFRTARTVLPLKLLAVRSGLASYGKNNISYVPEWGSYHRLMAFFSDCPAEEDEWLEPSMMKECETCTACIRACPTGAITSDRFLIRAERCLTFLNERRNEFPSWVDPAWHHRIFGCLRCQEICPQNARSKLRSEDWLEFSGLETAFILRNIPWGRLPPATRRKIQGVCLAAEYALLSRNLRPLLLRDEPFSRAGIGAERQIRSLPSHNRQERTP